MKIEFNLNGSIAESLKADLDVINQQAKEAFLVALFRQGQITHHQFATALGLSKFQSNEVLEKHQASWGPTVEEIREEALLLRKGGMG